MPMQNGLFLIDLMCNEQTNTKETLRNNSQQGRGTYACNSSRWEVETEGSGGQGNSWLTVKFQVSLEYVYRLYANTTPFYIDLTICRQRFVDSGNQSHKGTETTVHTETVKMILKKLLSLSVNNNMSPRVPKEFRYYI